MSSVFIVFSNSAKLMQELADGSLAFDLVLVHIWQLYDLYFEICRCSESPKCISKFNFERQLV